MPDTLNDRIERHEALAEAATQGRWEAYTDDNSDMVGVFVPNSLPDSVVCVGDYPDDNTLHIAANDPATIKAFCAVVKADDPEPCEKCGGHGYPCGECVLYRAWKQRQDLRAALYDALGKGVE